MNNVKKTGLGLLVASLAFGFSAFTTIKRGNVYRYYKTNLTYPAASNPNGYYYYSGEHCMSEGSLCSAEWNIGTRPAPSEGAALPASGSAFQTGTEIEGHFE